MKQTHFWCITKKTNWSDSSDNFLRNLRIYWGNPPTKEGLKNFQVSLWTSRHIHQNHRFLHTRTQFPGGHQQIPQIHQHQDRRQMTTYTDNHKQCPSNWTSEQINFIVGSKIMNERSMDTNLDKIDINQKNKQKIKDAKVWRDGETTTCSGHKTDTR